LASEIQLLESLFENESSDAEANENYETLEGLTKLRSRIDELVGEATLLSIDDVTDDRFKLEDKKRCLAQEIFQLTAGKKIEKAKNEYNEIKNEVADLVGENGNDKERHQLAELLAREHTFISSTNPAKIESATQSLSRLKWQILTRMPDFLVGMFQHLIDRRASMNDEMQAKTLIEIGKKHIALEDWDQLRDVNGRLLDLLPQAEQQADDFRHFTGIV
jgi:molecular chaperone DnaK